MASFSAELRVAGHAYALTSCDFGVTQATHQRGRVSTKVRYGPVQLALAVPDGEFLFGWAAEPQKRLPVEVVFRDGDGGSVLETLRLPAAYCVAYAEQFSSGDAATGAYQCHLTLSDPEGWMLTAGGPADVFVGPAAREHGLPQTLSIFERENGSDAGLDMALRPYSSELVEPSQGLAAVLASCISIRQPELFDPEINPNLFRNQVVKDLEKIYSTPTGKKMLESLAASGKKVIIHHSMNGNAIGGYQMPAARFLLEDGTRGLGTDSQIRYNPSQECVGTEEVWETRPPAIGLAHELVHAEQAAYGRMPTGKAPNGPEIKHPSSTAAKEVDVRELEAVGIPPHHQYPISENKIRAEWDPEQPSRGWY